jgi:Ankyrin repeats (3 copies)
MDAKSLPPHPNLDQYKKQAKELLKAWRSADAESQRRLRRFHPRPQGAKLALADAQLVIAREHGFESWPKFVHHIEEIVKRHSPVSRFEIAVDAIVGGDLQRLTSLLREDPSLVRARSTREHHATLLHYVSANGVEDYRQKTPKNIVAIAKLLLDQGSEIDATGDMYGGGSTTLGLTATSIHPFNAGVLEPLIDLLVERGADFDARQGRMSIVEGCLANDRPRGAVLIAARGAKLDFEAAAGVGRLDLVQTYVDRATQKELNRGFIWACEYGWRDVVEFLIDRGIDLHFGENTGQTAAHLAAHHGELEIVRLLIARGAPLEAKNAYGGTVLGQTTWSVMNTRFDVDWPALVALLLEAGADAREADYPTGNAEVDELLKRALDR